jgi:multiple sugar transport system permease protein
MVPLKNFRIPFVQTDFGTLLVNTLLLSVFVVLITVVAAVPAGYVLTRLRRRGAETIGIVVPDYFVPSGCAPPAGRASHINP